MVMLCVLPGRERIREIPAEIGVEACFVSDQAIVERGADCPLIEAGANEHEFLAAIAPYGVPIAVEQLAELRIAWPMRL